MIIELRGSPPILVTQRLGLDLGRFGLGECAAVPQFRRALQRCCAGIGPDALQVGRTIGKPWHGVVVSQGAAERQRGEQGKAR